ncbi:MAG: hypothetical protein LBH03_05385 [Holophagales bacterium]|jgi:hypothetical protein|nr:hypothetical protein [Holophagales bacterium]
MEKAKSRSEKFLERLHEGRIIRDLLASKTIAAQSVTIMGELEKDAKRRMLFIGLLQNHNDRLTENGTEKHDNYLENPAMEKLDGTTLAPSELKDHLIALQNAVVATKNGIKSFIAVKDDTKSLSNEEKPDAIGYYRPYLHSSRFVAPDYYLESNGLITNKTIIDGLDDIINAIDDELNFLENPKDTTYLWEDSKPMSPQNALHYWVCNLIHDLREPLLTGQKKRSKLFFDFANQEGRNNLVTITHDICREAHALVCDFDTSKLIPRWGGEAKNWLADWMEEERELIFPPKAQNDGSSTPVPQ